MNDIKIFNNPEFGEVRTIVKDGEPWFVGRDVAIALGYAKPETSLRDRVETEDTEKHGILTAGGTQQMIVVNESGLYSLIFGSKLESAKKFKKWVTSDVLPSIRKSGSYTLPESTDGKIALLAQGHTELRRELDSVKEEVETIKNDLPILPVEADLIVRAVKKRGVEVLGGKKSNAYRDRATRQRLYNDLYHDLKRNFAVRSYKAIKRKDADKAVLIVEQYRPPLFLQEQIEEMNGGMTA